MNKHLTLVAASILITTIVGHESVAQQEAKREKASAPIITVFLENDRVKVYEGRFRPGDKTSGTGSRPARVEFAITDGHMKNYYPDGKVEEVMWKAGEVKWSEAATFRQENIGRDEFRIRVVQLK